MFDFLRPKSEFSRNVLTLMTGTTIAKAISIAVIPILTRLYSPEDFGLLGFYSSVVAVAAVVATGRYELAVVQARNARDGDQLVLGSILLAATFSVVLFTLIAIWQRHLVAWLGQAEIGPWLYLLPVSVLLTASYQALSYWLNRRKDYRRMGGNRVLQSGIAACGNLGFGLFRFGVAGLILGHFIGLLITTLLLFGRFLPQHAKANRLRMLALYRRYREYPTYDLPASSMNVMAQQGPNLLLTPLFGALSAGHYFLIQRLFMLPVTMLSSSVGSVFRQAATEQYHATGSFRDIFWTVCKRLVAIAILPTIIFMIVAEPLFAVVFGPNWAIAGEYARVLAPMFMLKFIVSPLTYAFYIRGKLHFNTIGQCAYLVMVMSAILIGYTAESFALVIYLMSALTSLLYLMYFMASMRLAT